MNKEELFNRRIELLAIMAEARNELELIDIILEKEDQEVKENG